MKIIVIGHGMVGHKLVECLALQDAHDLDITVLGEESRPAYDRVHLSEFFSGKTAEDLSLVEPGFFERHGVQLKLNAPAVAVDRDARTVTVASGETLPYDRLVFATGSYPFVPPVPGRERGDCFVYRTIDDLEAMRECGARSKTGTVVGGGLLGLECAKALRDMGLQTHVVEFAPRLMAVQVDDGGGRVLRGRIEELGVTVHTHKNTTAIVDGEAGTHRMQFADGSHLDTDMIVFSAGIRPRDDLARACGLDLGARGGIVIDDACRTSDPHIYAIGECALWGGQLFGLVAPGYDMARVVAKQLLGDSAEFAGADMSTKLKLMGVDVASIGDAHGNTPGSRTYQFSDERKQIYKKLVVSDCGKYLLGGVMVGDASEYGTLLQMMLNRIELPASPEFLILPQADGNAKPALGVEALPAAAQICSCNNVSKGELCAAVCAGATDIGALKSATGAGTSCGGCVPLVTQVMKAEMKKQGLAVNNHVCEHFPYSRQELYHLVRVEGLRSFGALLAKHGRGLGCDICKPAVASILASCWNEFVLKKEHASLQDTNDYYLANIQRDGTYSVVPRMPGGEVTPDGPDRGRAGREEIRPLHEDHRRSAGRSVRRACRAIAVDLGRANRGRLRIGPRVRQIAAYREVVRRFDVVPLWRRRFGRARGRTRESLQGAAHAAQDQVRRVGLHPRMRGSAGQGCRRDRHREGLESVRVRQRRHEAASRGTARRGPR
ncbi:NAD(P)H-dependent nitrite reductase large subunit [Paraburkholderia youngii]